MGPSQAGILVSILTHAILKVDNSHVGGVDGSAFGAVYKGLAMGNKGSGNFIYATNFRDGVTEMYDAKFTFIKSFTDPNIIPDAPNPGFAPFGNCCQVFENQEIAVRLFRATRSIEENGPRRSSVRRLGVTNWHT